MKVFLLKNENSPQDYYRQVLSQKYEPVFVPLLDHKLFINETIDFLNTKILHHKVLIVTSQRAVECLNECLQSTKISQTHKNNILQLPVYTIGPSTYQYLKEIGFCDVRGRDSGNGHKLSEVILKEVGDESIIYFTGKIRKDIIPNNMVQGNKVFSEFVVYSTEEIGKEDVVDKLHANSWVIFFSSQGTMPIVNYIKGKSFKIGVIGPTTNEYLIRNDIVADLVCEKPTADSLFDQLTSTRDH